MARKLLRRAGLAAGLVIVLAGVGVLSAVVVAELLLSAVL